MASLYMPSGTSGEDRQKIKYDFYESIFAEIERNYPIRSRIDYLRRLEYRP